VVAGTTWAVPEAGEAVVKCCAEEAGIHSAGVNAHKVADLSPTFTVQLDVSRGWPPYWNLAYSGAWRSGMSSRGDVTHWPK
jgi:hypothetical protein